MPVSEGLDYFERYRLYVRRSPLATLGVPASALMALVCLPVVAVVFLVGGLAAQALGTLAEFTGSAVLHDLSMMALAGGVTGWATGFVCVLVSGIGVTALPVIANAIIRRRLGMHRPPRVNKLGGEREGCACHRFRIQLDTNPYT